MDNRRNNCTLNIGSDKKGKTTEQNKTKQLFPVGDLFLMKKFHTLEHTPTPTQPEENFPAAISKCQKNSFGFSLS